MINGCFQPGPKADKNGRRSQRLGLGVTGRLNELGPVSPVPLSSQGPGDSQAHLGRTSPAKPTQGRGRGMETRQARRLVLVLWLWGNLTSTSQAEAAFSKSGTRAHPQGHVCNCLGHAGTRHPW